MSAIMGVLLAVAYKAPPGPINIETIRRGCLGGVAPALALQTGALVGNLTYACLALFGVGLLLRGGPVERGVEIVGVALMLYLGVAAIRGRYALSNPAAEQAGDVPSLLQTAGVGATISLANPVAIVFWLTLSTQATSRGEHPLLFLAGFAGGLALTSLAIALLAGTVRHWLTPRLLASLAWLCGVGMISYGLRMGWQLLA